MTSYVFAFELWDNMTAAPSVEKVGDLYENLVNLAKLAQQQVHILHIILDDLQLLDCSAV